MPIRVETDHIMTGLRETSGGHAAEVPKTEDANTHS
jgi:hypothetical protein